MGECRAGLHGKCLHKHLSPTNSCQDRNGKETMRQTLGLPDMQAASLAAAASSSLLLALSSGRHGP